MGRHVHKLTYDPSGQLVEVKSVEVKRYVRKIQYEPNAIPYICAVWPKCQETYETRTINFTYPHIDYNWNYVDQLIQEEVRLNGIYKFLELFDKSLWVPPNENMDRKRENSSPHLRPTTDDLSIFVITPDGLYPRRSSVHPIDEKLTKDTKLDKIYQAMKNNATKKTKKGCEKIEEVPIKPTRIEFTKAIHIDIDPNKKSDRKETAILHYDVIYNVDTCYHFQLNWLACTARLIEELLQQWGRNAEKYGLKLVEAPVEQAMSLTDNNPFQSPTSIKLSLLPPTLEELEKLGKKLNPEINHNLYFEIELVKHFKFVLDVEADNRFPKEVDIIYSYHKTPYKYSQYIHRSGVAFIQICDPGEGFLWVNNRIYTTHNISNKNTSSPNPDLLLKEFQNFCNDKVALKKFWDDVVNSIVDFIYEPNVTEQRPDSMTKGNSGNESESSLKT
ncbi:hypothetical protein RclHR1_01370013 [Rhizophagus clarus]|uniref:DEPDC5 C-terminal domain-containing protein n=1 Tax=Rhizophagus clarus TaxID=94130 RepID=A0A2Z6QQL1_9GLOM|nr:hypothetical protein RclHR1_01370013 [Rhizophagus clarus]